MRIRLIWSVSLLLALFSCSKDDNFSALPSPSPGKDGPTPSRVVSEESRRVLVFVSAGFNSLASYLDENLRTIERSPLPRGYYADDVLLVLGRRPVPGGGYGTPASPVLFRVYADADGTPVHDTLKVWGPENALCTKEFLSEALSYVGRQFPAKGYGMIFSSHALGWIPPSYTVPSGNDVWTAGRRSIGQDRTPDGSIELSLEDFADALPFRMDYVIFDACLMGCVEVAWQLRGKVDIVGFSPAEILAQGFDYSTMTARLFAKEPDPTGFCQDYFARYAPYGDATVSVVDTRRLDALAGLCKSLFARYDLSAVPPASVQRYFRPSVTPNCTVLYDLKDALVKAGISAAEEAELDAALADAILYKAATDQFLSIPIVCYSGLSLYLPSAGNAVLDAYYREHILWNRAVELVK